MSEKNITFMALGLSIFGLLLSIRAWKNITSRWGSLWLAPLMLLNMISNKIKNNYLRR